MIKQSIMFLLACALVTCRPTYAIDFKDRQDLFMIQSCLIVGSASGNTDVIYHWNKKLVDFAAKHQVQRKQYQDVMRYTQDLFQFILTDEEKKEVISVCIKEAGISI